MSPSCARQQLRYTNKVVQKSGQSTSSVAFIFGVQVHSGILSKLDYLLWAFRKSLRGGGEATACPACGETGNRLVRRKWGVTALRECPACLLRFRTPKDDPGFAEKFYADEVYKQGFTTDLPSDDELKAMLERRFAGTEKDFSAKIDIMRAAGLQPGARVLDFGGSWGYASWQFRQAGFEVVTYEIGHERVQYAKKKLGCTVVEDLRSLDGTIDCFFSAHVIEHLPNPNIFFEEAEKVLAPDGVMICCCPNGAEERQRREGIKAYDQNWGKVHPLMVTPGFIKSEARRRGFVSCNVYSSPVDTVEVAARRDGDLSQSELLAIAYRSNRLPIPAMDDPAR
jgi:SAM-dependent methyltransferase